MEQETMIGSEVHRWWNYRFWVSKRSWVCVLPTQFAGLWWRERPRTWIWIGVLALQKSLLEIRFWYFTWPKTIMLEVLWNKQMGLKFSKWWNTCDFLWHVPIGTLGVPGAMFQWNTSQSIYDSTCARGLNSLYWGWSSHLQEGILIMGIWKTLDSMIISPQQIVSLDLNTHVHLHVLQSLDCHPKGLVPVIQLVSFKKRFPHNQLEHCRLAR